MTAVSWAVLADVTAVTGTTVDQATLDAAKRDIELSTGLIESVERVYLTRRDYYWLKLACCYQAAWRVAQPDYLERLDVSSSSQDGQSATFNADALALSAMARRAIKRLSWKGSRTLLPLGMRDGARPGNPLAGNTSPLPQYIGGDPTTDGSDYGQEFSPL